MSSPRTAATLGLMSTALRLGSLPRDAHTERVDLRTSACDWRAALCIAGGVPLEEIGPLGNVRRTVAEGQLGLFGEAS